MGSNGNEEERGYIEMVEGFGYFLTPTFLENFDLTKYSFSLNFK